MTAWAGPYLAGCVLLAGAGAAKVREPAATQEVLRRLAKSRLAVPAWAVRIAGVAEIALGTAGVSSSSAFLPVLVASCYLVFGGFVAVSRASGGGEEGCGCFGGAGSDVPMGPLHIGVNLGLATAALAVAVSGGLRVQGMERLGVSLLAGVLAWVVYQVLVPLPRLMAAVKLTRR